MRLIDAANTKLTLARVYDRHPITVTLLLSAVFLLLVWHAPLLTGAVIPNDYQSVHYPLYVDAVRAARHNPFSLYNPFNDAGQVTWNLFAFNDPVQWLPILLPELPGYASLQFMQLAHLLLIPVGLLLVAWANDVPRRRWILIAGISVAAYSMGPTLKYMEQSSGIVAYSYAVLLFGSLEAFRRSGRTAFALLAGASAAYIVESFVYPAVFLPVLVVAYGVANWRQLFVTRGRVVSLVGALVLVLVIASPALLLGAKIDRTLETAGDLLQFVDLRLGDVMAMLGAPLAVLPLVAIPSALIALVASGFANLSRWQRWAYGLAIGALALYGFGDATPFGPVFRHIYPPAGLVGQPYATWYVLLPFLLVVATIGLRDANTRALRFSTGLSFLATAAALAQGASALAAIAVLITQVVTFWRPRFVVIVAVLIAQWVAVDWLPFTESASQPRIIPSAEAYLNPYRGLEPYLSGRRGSSIDAFRIANIGMPASFGSSAGMFRYYSVAADSDSIPSELIRELQTDKLQTSLLPGYFDANPGAFASGPWERLAIRYYLFSPTAFAALPRGALNKKGLHEIAAGSDWKVVEDDFAAPFVVGVQSTGGHVPIAAAMTRDSFTFTVPPGLDVVRIAQNYDSWWHAVDDQGIDRTSLIRDDGGQLALRAEQLAGRRILVRFTDRATTIAVGLTIVVQVGLGLTWLAFRIRKSRLKRVSAFGRPGTAPPHEYATGHAGRFGYRGAAVKSAASSAVLRARSNLGRLMSWLRVKGSNAQPPGVLWVFGALALTGLAVVGIDLVDTCGVQRDEVSCSQLFTASVPHAMWLAYISVGIAALFVATSVFWPARANSSRPLQTYLGWVFAGAAVSVELIIVVALQEYYILAIVAVHWLLLRAFERGGNAASSLLDLSVILVSWVAGATMASEQPLSASLFGMGQSRHGRFALIVLASALLLNVHILRAPRDQGAWKARISAAVLNSLSLAIFMLLSFRQSFFPKTVAAHHWGFFVGPVELVRQGGWLLWDVPSQYGFLSTLAIAIMPFASAWTSMYVLDAVLIFASACMLFFMLRSLRVGRFSSGFSFLTTLVLVYLLPGAYPWFYGPQFFPSIGAFRFFWVESLIFILFIDYLKKFSSVHRRMVIAGGSVIWLCGVLWSAESAIYVTVVWVPSLLALVFAESEGQTIRARIRMLARPMNLVLAGLPLLLLAVAVSVIQLTYTLALGHGPDYFAFYEFGVNYATGFGAYPINGFGSVWLLVLGLSVCVAACVLVLRHSKMPSRAIPLLYAASATIWVVSSYFISRSADSNVTNVATPFWMAIVAILLVLDREELFGVGERYVRFALVAPLTVAVCVTIGNPLLVPTITDEVRAGYTANIPGLLPLLPQGALAVLDRAHVAPSDPMVFDSLTLMPERPGVRSDAVPGRRWLPANPSILLTVIPPSRKLVYFDRFTARRPMEGWYLRAHAPTNTCENLDPKYVTTKSYVTAEWDLSWCSLRR